MASLKHSKPEMTSLEHRKTEEAKNEKPIVLIDPIPVLTQPAKLLEKKPLKGILKKPRKFF